MRRFEKTAEGMDRLRNTFFPKIYEAGKRADDNYARMEILTRFLRALAFGELTVNGQNPDAQYYLGEYILHGGRIFFDLSGLSEENQKKFVEYLMPKDMMAKQIHARFAATHDIDKKTEEPVDVKLKMASSLVKGLSSWIGASYRTHYGMNVAIGGDGNIIQNYQGVEVEVSNNGNFGHLYINYDPNKPYAIQAGFEEADALCTNQFTGDYHSPTGGGGKFSAFGEARLQDFQKGHDFAEGAPLLVTSDHDSNNKYNWNRVVIDDQALERILDESVEFDPSDEVYSVPRNAVVVESEEAAIARYNNMLAYRSAHGYLKPTTELKKDLRLQPEGPIDVSKAGIVNIVQHLLEELSAQQIETAKKYERPPELGYITQTLLYATNKDWLSKRRVKLLKGTIQSIEALDVENCDESELDRLVTEVRVILMVAQVENKKDTAEQTVPIAGEGNTQKLLEKQLRLVNAVREKMAKAAPGLEQDKQQPPPFGN